MNKTQLIAAIQEDLGEEWSKADVKAVLESFQSVVFATVKSGEPVTVSGFVKFAQRVRPAIPAGKRRNPFTGEEKHMPRRPASKTAKVTPLKAFKDAVA